MCSLHYQRLLRHGDPIVAGDRYILPGGVADRLWPRVAVGTPDVCWEWHGARTPNGYGVMRGEGRNVLVYRAAWELTNGPVPEGLELDHLCRNHACCNPAHLEPVTHAENMRRMMLARTHCKQGHELTDENTTWSADGNHRKCRACVKKWQREKYLRAKARGVS